MNSQMISLSNSLTPCDPFEIIFQTFLTDMRLPYLQAIFHKGGDHLAHRKLHVMQLQAVVVLYGKMPFPKMPLQDSGGLSRIGYEKMHMPAAFSLQLRKRLLLQQHSMVDDPNVIRQKGDLRKDVAGDQDGLSPFVAEAADKGTDLRDADRIQPVDGLIQDQQLRVMHDREGNRQPLLHTEGILGKQLFVLVGQAHQIQRVFDCAAVRNSPQGGKNTQVFRACQVGIKAGRLDQAADPRQQLFFIAL